MRKCPTCFREAPPAIEKLSCVGSCERESPARLNKEYGGRDVLVRPAFDAALGSCPRCRVPSHVEACPHCQGVIFPEWRSRTAPRVTCIAMAGARTTGKSVYLAVLKQQLNLFLQEHGSYLRPLGDTEQHYKERYGDALYVHRRILAPTVEAARDPDAHHALIFQFVDAAGRDQILVLRDVAGEDLQDLRNRKAQLAFLGRADGVILLLDPMKVQSIRDVLHGVVPTVGELGGDGVDVLHQLLDLMREFSGGHAKSPIPVAVTLSKFDTLQLSGEIPGSELHPVMVRRGSPLQRDPSMRTPHHDQTDGLLLHRELESLLETLLGRHLLNLLGHAADRYHYFAVSALGASPEGDAIHSAGIAPFRVLDPVKWILAR